MRLGHDNPELAHRDPLTGPANRRQNDNDLAAAATGDHLLLNLDHFRDVNDSHGHQFGDRVLVATAPGLQSAARPSDRPYRPGGEEFAVLLRGCTLTRAPEVAERGRVPIELPPPSRSPARA